MKNLIVILSLLILTACNGAGGGSIAPSLNTTTPPALGNTDPTPTPTPDDSVSVTVYSLSKTVAPMGGFPLKTYTATATCAQIGSDAYCWDDGIKDVVIAGNTYTYSYWRAYVAGGNLSFNCNGGCPNDAVTSPTLMISPYTDNFTDAAINLVFSSGIETTASCTEDAGVITCPNFMIDTN